MDKFDEKQNLTTEIKSIMNDLIQIYDIEYKKIKPHVDYIIKSNIKDMVYIEKTIEQLLNIPYKPSYKLFIKLCDYVSQFNKQISLEYLKIYKDLYEEDIPKTKKKTNT